MATLTNDRPVVVGNWKMMRTPAESAQYVSHLLESVRSASCDIVLLPPALCLESLRAVVSGTNIALGAQDVHHAEDGAHTGDVSARMLTAVGAEYVLVGHSERRSAHHESDILVNLKVRAALRHGLIPIVCIGETADERLGGYTAEVVDHQVGVALSGLDGNAAARTVFAYEPVWAVGAGLDPVASEANQILGKVRLSIERRLGQGPSVRLLYGGSVRAENAGDLLRQDNVNGVLVGAATADVDRFTALVRAASTALAPNLLLTPPEGNTT